mgnify:CR=1 FL=1
MQKKSIAVNYILNTTYQILILIVPLITTPYISRVLGAEGIGVYSYTYSVVSYCGNGYDYIRTTYNSILPRR